MSIPHRTQILLRCINRSHSLWSASQNCQWTLNLRQICALPSVSVSLIYGKTGNGNVQLVLQNFELKSDVAGFTIPTSQPVSLQIRLLQDAKCCCKKQNDSLLSVTTFCNLQEPELLPDRLVKRPTSLFNSFCSNFAKQGARFCCPFSTKLYG